MNQPNQRKQVTVRLSEAELALLKSFMERKKIESEAAGLVAMLRDAGGVNQAEADSGGGSTDGRENREAGGGDAGARDLAPGTKEVPGWAARGEFGEMLTLAFEEWLTKQLDAQGDGPVKGMMEDTVEGVLEEMKMGWKWRTKVEKRLKEVEAYCFD
jgi:hypothetical protein